MTRTRYADILRLPLLWLALNLADAQITIMALNRGLVEANPLMASFTGGTLIVVKYVLSAVVLAALFKFRLLKLLPALCVGIGLVVVWNLCWLLVAPQ